MSREEIHLDTTLEELDAFAFTGSSPVLAV